MTRINTTSRERNDPVKSASDIVERLRDQSPTTDEYCDSFHCDAIKEEAAIEIDRLRNQPRWIYTVDQLPPVGKYVQCLWFFQDNGKLIATSEKAQLSHGFPMPEFWQFENRVEAIRPVLWAPVDVPDVKQLARVCR